MSLTLALTLTLTLTLALTLTLTLTLTCSKAAEAVGVHRLERADAMEHAAHAAQACATD